MNQTNNAEQCQNNSFSFLKLNNNRKQAENKEIQ